MLTGQRLFVGETAGEIIERVGSMEIPSPRAFNRRVPEALEQITLTALQRDRDDRFEWASDLAEALQRLLLTSDAIFGRKELAQYMKSTFAEEIERERLRSLEYASVDAGDADPAPGAEPAATVAAPPPQRDVTEVLASSSATPTDPLHAPAPDATPTPTPASVPAPPVAATVMLPAPPVPAKPEPPPKPEPAPPSRPRLHLSSLVLGLALGLGLGFGAWLAAGRAPAAIPLTLASDPADAEMRVNGEVVKPLGTPGIFAGLVEPGRSYELVVEKPGYASWTRAVRPASGERAVAEFALLRRAP
jgi:hypothetical protein